MSYGSHCYFSKKLFVSSAKTTVTIAIACVIDARGRKKATQATTFFKVVFHTGQKTSKETCYF